jgi:hypothetical protein
VSLYSAKIQNVLLILVVGIITSTCIHSWEGIPINVPARMQCDPRGNFPQLIQLPLFRSASQTVESCGLHDRERTAIAIALFQQHYENQFTDRMGVVSHALNKLMVEWSSKEKKISGGYDMHGYRFLDHKIVGLTRTPSWVWVYTEYDERICQTSLVHELVHVALWAIHGSGDPDHLGRLHKGWTIDHTAFIQEMNETLCILGI